MTYKELTWHCRKLSEKLKEEAQHRERANSRNEAAQTASREKALRMQKF